MTTDTVISKVWSFCHTLRDDGVGYGDYLEQLTFLLFLKMADEYGKPPHHRDVGVPEAYSWARLRSMKGAELEVQYVDTLRELGTGKGMLGQISTCTTSARSTARAASPAPMRWWPTAVSGWTTCWPIRPSARRAA